MEVGSGEEGGGGLRDGAPTIEKSKISGPDRSRALSPLHLVSF